MNNDEQEIRQLISTWMSATKSGDTKTVLSLMSEDAIFLVTGQQPMLGRAAFAEASKAQANQSFKFDGTSEIQEIKVLGDWAYMWTKLSVTVTRPGAEPMVRAGHTLTILKKEKGKWVLARDANMLAPAKPPSP
jgi:uncharacterized protein (TIGR02246 family)